MVGQHKQHAYIKIFNVENDALNLSPQFYYNSCACNEIDSIMRRHILGDIPNFVSNNTELQKLEREFDRFAGLLEESGLRFKQLPYRVVIDNTRPNIKARYKRAYHNLLHKRLIYSDLLAKGQSFIKYEKMDITKYEERKPPRLIQHRSFEFLYLLKSFVLDFDMQIKHTDVVVNGQKPCTIFAKSHDNVGVASIIEEHWKSFRFPCAYCLDHSKFDGHVNVDLLNIAHSFWNRIFKNKLLRRMLSHTIVNKFVTKNGIRYKFKGARCSGEYTTSTENSLLNYFMLTCWVKSSGISNYKILVNGDDSIVFLDQTERHKLLPLAYFNNFNMETELDRIAFDLHQISFCQASPMLQDDRLTMIKDPIRTISRALYTSEQHRRCLDKLLSASGLCELACNQGIPILQEFALFLLRSGNFSKPLQSIDKIPACRSRNVVRILKIKSETRDQFSRAFGIDPWQQIQIEQQLAGLSILTPEYQDKLQEFILINKDFIQI